MYKAIIFDLGGVIFTNGFKSFVNYLSEQYSLDKEYVLKILDGELGTKYREGKIDRDKFWSEVLKQLNIRENPNLLEEKWISGYVLIEETRALVFELAKKYKIYFLSDNIKERVEKLDEKYGFISWFEDGVFSHEVGFRKPNKEIYLAILNKINVDPSKTIFIDDKEICLPPAKALGIEAILFETPEKLRKSLEKLGVI